MKTVSNAHFGWSRLKVKATSSASRPEAVVFAAKIDGIQREPMTGFAVASGPASDRGAGRPGSSRPRAGAELLAFARLHLGLGRLVVWLRSQSVRRLAKGRAR